jgi:hypothetical protein
MAVVELELARSAISYHTAELMISVRREGL